MKKGFDAGLALFAAILPAGFILAQSQGLEQKIWTLLDDGKAAYVSLAESDLRALGAGLDLPDGGRSITALAGKADGGATRQTGSSSVFAATTSIGTSRPCASPASIRRRKITRGSSSSTAARRISTNSTST